MPVAAWPGIGLAAIVATPGPEVLELQAALIEAVAPFTGNGATAAAFATTAREPQINADTLTCVEHHVPEHSGKNCVAHLTVGLAPEGVVQRIEAERHDESFVHPAAMAIFRLGNNGTARTRLKTWPLPA